MHIFALHVNIFFSDRILSLSILDAGHGGEPGNSYQFSLKEIALKKLL
jgi:hypothetical protein